MCLIKKILIPFFLLLISFTKASGQNQKVDSLENILRNHILEDTTRVNLLNEIGYAIYSQNPEKANAYAEQSEAIANRLYYLKGKAASLWIKGLTTTRTDKRLSLNYFRRALFIAEKVGDKIGICNYLMAIGVVTKDLGDIKTSDKSHRKALQIAKELQDKKLTIKILYNISQKEASGGNYTEAKKLFQEVIDIANEIGDKQMLGRVYGNLASIYFRRGNYPIALEYHLSSLKIKEQMNDMSGMYYSLVNIAGIQSEQKDFDKALKTLHKAFLISKNMNDSSLMSVCFTNLGNIYQEMGNPAALQYLQQALIMAKDNNTTQSINTLTNIGSIYTSRGEFDKAMKKFEEALALANQIKFKPVYGEIWIKIGFLYFAQKQYNQAINYTQKALDLAEELKYINLRKDCYKQLSDIYAATGAFNNALSNYIQFKSTSDSLFNKENIRQMTAMESSYEFDKERRIHEMEKVSQEVKIKSQRQIILSLIIISFLIMILAFTIYWSNKLKKKVLKLEIKNINQELEVNQKAMAAATLKLIQNSERDTYCIKMLENIKKNTVEEGLNDIRTLIAEYKFKSSNSNWGEFEILFEKVNASFYETLNQRFPTLTPNERKLCVFLKLNMSNTHISQITFQSEEALKKARLRLRKKMELDRDTNLATFIQSL